ncbi:MAG: maleylacetoacetate isomerase [Pseudomonadota bacterium]
MVKLYSYWRSTTSYRVRIALSLKGVGYETTPVDLVAGAQKDPSYTALNPVAGVPTLVLDDGTVLTQSMAILEWLEATHPTPALLPDDPVAAAQVRAAAMVVASDIHPVNNLKVGGKLKQMGHSQDDVVAWMNDWMTRGFAAFQALLPKDTEFSFGNAPSLADICLIPQLYNAHRWGCDLTPFARLTEIEARCLALPAFYAARPETQPDAQ